MVTRKEARMWGCLNCTKDVFVAVEICQAFGLGKEEEERALSLWDSKRRIVRNSRRAVV